MSSHGINDDNWRDWERLNHDILALIFKKIPSDEMARTISFICKSWQEVVAGPCCWTEINIEEWCRRVNHPDVIDAIVGNLVRRSRYMLRRLSAYRIQNWGFSLTASFGTNLNVLEIPMSEVNDSAIKKYSRSLTSLTTLDISYCNYITYKGIEILGNNCTSLISLKRNLTPVEFESTQNNEGAAQVNEREALAIANTMFELEQLELAYGRFSDYGLDAILSNCKALSFLDLSGCHVEPEQLEDGETYPSVEYAGMVEDLHDCSTILEQVEVEKIEVLGTKSAENKDPNSVNEELTLVDHLKCKEHEKSMEVLAG
ncbi:F-box protein FBW2 [Dendrobium catenatum]|uniref:F-box protein FBW2 n=1 Tax=Dendrobium catenatum TaxID=906689 RepID=A0A2I0VAK7_9ASPA|nr:F-box protein FBW2 [Dendrobium catenatum]